MIRPLGIEYKDAWYHAMNRSLGRSSGRSLVYKLTGRLNYGMAVA